MLQNVKSQPLFVMLLIHQRLNPQIHQKVVKIPALTLQKKS
jgi:hypothetical protein